MRKEEYEILFNIEDNYWWYVGLRKLVLSFVHSITKREENIKILDAGCGTGKMLVDCKGYKIYGIDYSEEAIRYCKLRKVDNVVRGSICSMPIKNYSFDIVISLDVLYHIGVENDVKTLEGIYQIMNKGGMLLLNLPAYNFLRSKHDEAIHTRYRYTINHLKEKIERAGFKIEKVTYRNTFLFPIAFIKRIIEKVFVMNTSKVESDLKPLPNWLNILLTKILLFENFLIKSGISFPFGLSIYCICRKE